MIHDPTIPTFYSISYFRLLSPPWSYCVDRSPRTPASLKTTSGIYLTIFSLKKTSCHFCKWQCMSGLTLDCLNCCSVCGLEGRWASPVLWRGWTQKCLTWPGDVAVSSRVKRGEFQSSDCLIFPCRQVGHKKRKYEGAVVCLLEKTEVLACSQVPQERLDK